MGYRNKLGILSKQTHEEIHGMTKNQLAKRFNSDDPDGHVGCYEITNEVYEIGKYWPHDYLKEYSFPIFKRKATHKYFNNESEFYGITKEGFLLIINEYHDKIAKHFNELYEKKEDAEEYFLSKKREWDRNNWNVTPYYLDRKEKLVCSWKYEYAIFELVKIYNNIDWDNQVVTITGW